MSQQELEDLYRRVARASASLDWGYFEICQFIADMTDQPFTEVSERLMETDMDE